MYDLKKLAVIIPAAAAVLATAGAMPAAVDAKAVAIFYPVGDVNNDDAVDSSDASAILSYYAQISSGESVSLTQEQISNGDVDRNGVLDASDASLVLSYYSYEATLPAGEGLMDILSYIDWLNTPKPVGITAPAGLDPGAPGSIEYIINTAERVPHDEIKLYNIKEDNGNGGKPIFVRTYQVTTKDKLIMDEFAAEHFTPDMTDCDRLKYTWNWLHDNVDYADGRDGRPEYAEVYPLSFVEACFVRKAGQCIQYNGAFAEMMAYMGYDSYMLEQWNRPNNTVQHFATEAYISGKYYSVEVGDRNYDNPATGYKWMWFFDESSARFHGLE